MTRTYENVAVLIPCFNEEQTIGSVIDDFQKRLPKCRIYVYDNNSTDDTAEVARDKGVEVRREPQQGKGNVIRRMFREVEADCYVMVDGDNTYPASYAPAMVNKVLDGNCDMVIGDRLSSTYYKENKRPFHGFGNNLVRFLVNHYFKGEVRDIMTGYRAFSRLFVKSFPVLSKGFEIETEMTIHAIDKNMMIDSVTINYRDRPKGSVSKLNTFSDGRKVLKMFVKLYAAYKPFYFWLRIAIVYMVFAVILFNTSITISNFSLSILLFLFSAISITQGVILQSLRRKEKQDFEQRLIQIEGERK